MELPLNAQHKSMTLTMIWPFGVLVRCVVLYVRVCTFSGVMGKCREKAVMELGSFHALSLFPTGRHRWVMYKRDDYDASQVPSEW
jgi:hypothetical protein